MRLRSKGAGPPEIFPWKPNTASSSSSGPAPPLHRRHLRRPRQPQAHAHHGHGPRRSAHDDLRSRQLALRRRRHPGPRAHGTPSEAGRALRHRGRLRHDHLRRSFQASLHAQGRHGREYTCDALIIATGAGAGARHSMVRASSAECSPPPSSRPSSCRCSSPGSRGSRRRSADQERLHANRRPLRGGRFFFAVLQRFH